MNNAMLTIQYLEPGPQINSLPERTVREKLRLCFEILPVSRLILGWNIPEHLHTACEEVASSFGVTMMLWQPFLTGDGILPMRPEWRVIGINGKPIHGYQNMPEFTFMCPNNPSAQAAILEHFENVLTPPFRGVFLDRIRFPSPAIDPLHSVGCFCQHCHRLAEGEGIDLERIKSSFRDSSQSGVVEKSLINNLFHSQAQPGDLRSYFDFRERSITRIVNLAIDIAHQKGFEVGLDCFSPCLTRSVGQNLSALSQNADWIKVMTYGHTFGPAGLPYELSGFGNFLVEEGHLDITTAYDLLSSLTGLEISPIRNDLKKRGISSPDLKREISRAKTACNGNVLAGIELVDLPGITYLNQKQIKRDIQSIKSVSKDGFSISWDLWQIPLKNLELIREII